MMPCGWRTSWSTVSWRRGVSRSKFSSALLGCGGWLARSAPGRAVGRAPRAVGRGVEQRWSLLWRADEPPVAVAAARAARLMSIFAID